VQFRAWFVKESIRFREQDELESGAVANALLQRLHSYHDQLFFEVGRDVDGVNERVIAAGGDSDHFDAAHALVEAAAAISGWRITALKPPMGFLFVERYEDVELDPSACWFLPLESQHDPRLLGLQIGVPEV
jgi:hypothetical protein